MVKKSMRRKKKMNLKALLQVALHGVCVTEEEQPWKRMCGELVCLHSASNTHFKPARNFI
ncbi:hypothetical protein QR98_0106190 [Sarcoptes scabiei]|uniref:Uncharacterized protein n=1 Tax=Sarcoptes scabiei TaxID=52283 RepID=A0A132ALZ5_SARSC|nr:hypothetical protein QR98_0106190 [Sarcoptes scabiei]